MPSLPVQFKFSTAFSLQEARVIYDALVTTFSGANTLAFLSSLSGKTFFITRDRDDDNCRYFGPPQAMAGRSFYDDPDLISSESTQFFDEQQNIGVGLNYVLRTAQGQGATKKASPDAFDLQTSLSRTLFHELAHAVQSFNGSQNSTFGAGLGSTYAGVEALAIAAENLIYAKDRHLPSRIGHTSFVRPSYDPALPFGNVASVSYELVRIDRKLWGVFHGVAGDGGLIQKAYGQRDETLNFVTVTGLKDDLVTGVGGLSRTFKDVLSGSLSNERGVRASFTSISADVDLINRALQRLPASSGNVVDLLSAASRLTLSSFKAVIGNSNELFTDGSTSLGKAVNYVGPVKATDLSTQLGFTAGVPGILLGASGFSDGRRQIHYERAGEILTGSDMGSNLILSGYGQTGGTNVLFGGKADDIIVGGGGNDEIDASRGFDLVLGSTGRDVVRGSSKTIFALDENDKSPVVDTRALRGTTLRLAGGADGKSTTTLIDVQSYLGNQYRTVFIGNGKIPETFIAGKGGGDFTLKDGDTAIGNPEVVNIYRLSTALTNGKVPTISILNLGPKDIIFVDGKRFNGNIHKYAVSVAPTGQYAVNESGTSTWITEYKDTTLHPELRIQDYVKPFNPRDDLQTALDYLKLWNIDNDYNRAAVQHQNQDPGHVVIYVSYEEAATQNGYFPPSPPYTLYFLQKNRADQNELPEMPRGADLAATIPDYSAVEDAGASLRTSDHGRRDVSYVKATADASVGTIIFSEFAAGVQGGLGDGLPGMSDLGGERLRGLNLNVTGFRNGSSAGGVYFSTNDLAPGAFFEAPTVLPQITPENAGWQNVYPSRSMGATGQAMDLSSPASVIGYPVNPGEPTTIYGSSGFGGVGDVSGDDAGPDGTFVGSAGEDVVAFGGIYGLIKGNGGGDTIAYILGDGSVVVDESSGVGTPANVLILGAGIAPEGARVAGNRFGDIVISFDNGDSVTIARGLRSSSATVEGVQAVEFSNGTTWSAADLVNRARQAIDNPDGLFGDRWSQDFDPAGTAHSVNGGGGGDVIHYGRGYGLLEILEREADAGSVNTLTFGAGIAPQDVQLEGDVDGNVTLLLGGGDRIEIIGGLSNGSLAGLRFGVDRISFNDGSSWLWNDVVGRLSSPADGRNTLYGDGTAQTFDTLGSAVGVVGGGGGDTFLFEKGYGRVVVNELDVSSSAQNTLRLGSGISSEEITVRGDYAGNLTLELGGDDRVVLVGALLSEAGAYRGVQAVEFTDTPGGVWDLNALIARAATPLEPFDTLFGDKRANVFDPAGIAHEIVGRGGGDVIRYDIGYGTLLVDEVDTTTDAANAISFGPGVDPAAITVSASAQGDVVLVVGEGDTIILAGALRAFGNGRTGVQTLTFSDGTVWSYEDLLTKLGTAVSSRPVLAGDGRPNAFDPMGLSHLILGGGGGDTIFYQRGYGSVTIDERDGIGTVGNTVILGAGISAADVRVSGTPEGDLLILLGGADRLVVKSGLLGGAHPEARLQEIRFADGTFRSYDDLVLLAGTPRTGDPVVGDDGANLIDSQGLANESIGLGGGDTFRYVRGYGALRIVESDRSSAPWNILAVAAGLAPADLTVRGMETGDLVLDFGSGDIVTVVGALNSDLVTTSGIQGVVFADGTTIGYSELLGRANTPGAEVLLGDRNANVIEVTTATSRVVANGGGDTIVFHAGAGALTVDEVDASGGTNTLRLSGLLPTSITMDANASGDLILTGPGTDRIVILGALLNLDGVGVTTGMQRVTFDDGTAWSYDEMLARLAARPGTEHGDAAPQEFNAGGLATEVIGRGGGDLIHFKTGQGHLTIREDDGGLVPSNVLQIDKPFSRSLVSARVGASGDVVLDLGAGDVVTIASQMVASPDVTHGVQTIRWSSGEIWSGEEIRAIATGTLTVSPGQSSITLDEAVVPSSVDLLIDLPGVVSLNSLFVQMMDGGNTLGLGTQQGGILRLGNARVGSAAGQLVRFADGTTATVGSLVAQADEEGGVARMTGTAAGERLDPHGRFIDVDGGGGNDTFVYKPGYGFMQVKEQQLDATSTSTLLLEGLTLDQVKISSNARGDLFLYVDANDRILVVGQFAPGGRAGVDHVTFGDGTVLSREGIATLVTRPGPPNRAPTVISGTTGSGSFSEYPTDSGSTADHVLSGAILFADPDVADVHNSVVTGVTTSGGGSHMPTEAALKLMFSLSAITEPSAGAAGTAGWTFSSHNSDFDFLGAGETAGISYTVRIEDGRGGSVIQTVTIAIAGAETDDGSVTVSGTVGNDTLDDGGAANAVLIGGRGDDHLNGSAGNDTYVYSLGDGNDEILDESAASDAIDKLRFADLNASDLVFERQGDNLVGRVRSTGETIKVFDQFRGSGEGWGLELIVFADGIVWDRATIATEAWIRGDDNGQHIYGTDGANVFVGNKGDDYIEGRRGADEYRYASGDGADYLADYGLPGEVDTLRLTDLSPAQIELRRDGSTMWVKDLATGQEIQIGRQFENGCGIDRIVFADGAVWDRAAIASAAWMRGNNDGEHIYGTDEADVFVGNKGDDYIEGRAGSDEYRYASGDGADYLADYGLPGEVDSLRLTDLGPGQVQLRRRDSTMWVKDLTTGQEIQIGRQFENGCGIDRIVFADGTIWDRQQIQAAAWLRGTAGGEQLFSGEASDVLVGSGGDDYLEGNAGGDEYLYASGDGNDEIADVANATDVDILKLTDLNASDVELRRDHNRGGTTMWVTDKATGQSIRVDNQFASDGAWGIEQLIFADGTVWNRARLLQEAWLRGTPGGEQLFSSNDPSILVGGQGDDYLEGNGGSDDYRYASGDGNDEIAELGSTADSDVLTLNDLNPSDVELRRDHGRGGITMWVTDKSTGQSIRVDNEFSSDGTWGIERLVFADGTVWDRARMLQEAWLRGSPAADQLFSGSDANVLLGGQGDDYLEGNAGSDEYRYASGDGNDEIAEFANATDVDVLKLTNLIASQVELRRAGEDLFARDLSTGQQIKVDHQFAADSAWGIERLVFGDGSAIDRQTIAANAWFRGGDGNDSFDGGGFDSTFVGGKGNDYLLGRGGSDTYVYASGDGSDEIYDYSGSISIIDTLKFTDLNVADLAFSREGDHGYVTVLSTGDRLKLTYQGYSATEGWGIDRVQFADGSMWDRARLMKEVQAVHGTEAADNLTIGGDALAYGGGGDDIITGSGGGTGGYRGASVDYAITRSDAGQTLVQDSVTARDGRDTLVDLNNIQFADGSFAIADRVEGWTAATPVVNDRAASGTVVGTVATYAAFGGGNPVTYSIDGGDGTFAVDAASGVVTVASSANLDAIAEPTGQIRIIAHAGGVAHAIPLQVAVSNVGNGPVGLTYFAPRNPLVGSQTGSVKDRGNGSYQLTAAQGFLSGGLWGSFDVSKDAVWTAQLYFGTDDGGGDGIGFAIASPTLVAGQSFAPYGVELQSSFGIRFATWSNTGAGAPDSDYYQFLKNGDLSSGSSQFSPYVSMSNVEDGNWHDVRLVWNAATHTLSSSLDGSVAQSRSYDVAGAILNGSTAAAFGFGASTGGVVNEQRIRGLTLSQEVGALAVSAGTEGGALVAKLVGVDGDATDVLTYRLVNGAGQSETDSLFEIVNGNELRVRQGVAVPLVQSGSHAVRVEIANQAGQSIVRDVVVQIGPGLEALRLLSPVSSSIVEQHGSAVALGNDMYQLTPEQDDKAGNVWGFVDLSDDVVWTTRMFFGSNDNGADGIAFALAPAAMAPQDVGGGSLGVLNPGSIGLKFDTYRNVPHGDPSSDFAQIVLNGDVEASSTGVDGYHLLGNIEDGAWHDVTVRWSAETKTLSYSLDGTPIGSKSYDIVANLLNGSTRAWFGFGAATGDHHSDQRVQIVSVATGVGDGIVDIGATEGALVGVLEGSGSDPSDALSYQITDADGVTVVDSLFTIANGRELRVKSGITVTGASGDLHTLHVKVVSASGASLVREISVALRQVGSALDVTSGSTLTSTSGSDLFRVAAGFGSAAIDGFAMNGASHDVIEIGRDIFADWAHLLGATRQSGSDLEIALNSQDTLTLHNVALANFRPADVHFS